MGQFTQEAHVVWHKQDSQADAWGELSFLHGRHTSIVLAAQSAPPKSIGRVKGAGRLNLCLGSHGKLKEM